MFKKAIVLILVQILFCTAIYAGGIVPPRQDPDNPEWVKGEILVKFKDDVELQISSNRGVLETGIKSLNELNSKWQVSEMEKVFKTEEKRTGTKTIKTYTGEIIEVPQLFNIYKMKIPDDTDVEKAVEDFEKNPNVEYAEPNYIARICVIPDDPSFSNQWGLHNTGQYHLADADIDAPEAWEIETGDTTVVIAIIDTGVDHGHPDLVDKMVSTGYDFVNNDDDAMDDNGHGSHVAGIAAATTNNTIGIAGVAWNCKILPVKVLQSNGYGTYSDVASGVNYAANNGAKVINLSLGGYASSYVLQNALENAYTTSVIVGAAGNGSTSVSFYPAAWSFVIGVGASDVLYDQITQTWYEGVASFSNGGLNADLYAPGVNIYSTIPLFHPHTYSYASWNGTSMAAPFVTGTVALMRSYSPDWSNELIHGQLVYTSDDIVGGGRLNAFKALTEIPVPQLSLFSHTIVDTLPGDDQDGIADAGETVEMVFDIQNTWGQAYNVEAILNYHSYEDTCFVTIIDSVATFGGGVSPYAHVNNETNPYTFYVKTSTPNNTDVYFDYEITCDGGYSFTGTFNITTQRGIEIGGIIWSDETWTNDYLYIVTSNTLVDEGVTLTIEPGTRMQFCADKYLRIDGCLVAIGTEDSMIVFTSNAQNPSSGDWDGIKFYDTSIDAVFDSIGNYISGSIIKYAEIEFAGPGIIIESASPYIAFNYVQENYIRDSFLSYLGGGIILNGTSSIVEYNLIRNNFGQYVGGVYLNGFSGRLSENIIEDNSGENGGIKILSSSLGTITKNIIRGNSGSTTGGGICTHEQSLITYNVIYGNLCSWEYGVGGISCGPPSSTTQIMNNTIMNNKGGISIYRNSPIINYNNIIDNIKNNNQYEIKLEYYNTSDPDVNAQNNYWGTTNTDSIDTWIWDYYDDFDLAKVLYQPFETTPVIDAPGFLYQVEFNPPPPIGCEVDTFNLIFSKPMDISVQPYVTFGVCDPYTQHIIEGAWVDSTNWQGSYTFNLMTGDGINRLRVTTAKDCEGMEIPKDTRFSFVVDATGASSVGFIAQAGIGKVDLEWNGQDMVDLMGYNMYRYYKVTDSTYSDTTLVNTSMITDTTYCDMSVIPDTTYYYMYTGISTDFIESDYSDPASATPFNAALGDANGDLVVNVLDITTIVNYLLNLNPEPFLFDGADANQDGVINVLDIVEVVNIIMGRELTFKFKNKPENNPQLLVNACSIDLFDGADIAAMQFYLTGINISEESRLIAGELLKHMEYSYAISNDTIYVVLYNFNNNPLGINNGTLFTLNEGQIKSVNEVIACDSQAREIIVDYTPEENIVPRKFSLSQNYPNPFNPTTRIDYALPKESDVVLTVYNIKGQKVKTYKKENQPAGYHHIFWQGKDNNNRDVASGIYLYQIKAGKHVKTRKMLLLK